MHCISEQVLPATQASEEDVYEETPALRNKREKKRQRESGEAARVLFGGKAALGMAQEGANAEARRLASSGGGGEGGGKGDELDVPGKLQNGGVGGGRGGGGGGGGAPASDFAAKRKAKEEAVARLRGAGLGGGVHPAMMPEGSAPDAFAAAMAAEKRRKVMLMEVERLKGGATEHGAVLGGVEGGHEGAGDGGAEDGRRHDRHGAVPHADLERTAAAAASLAVAAEGGHAEGDASLATLKWQMYVGWVAILGLCGALVGRRFCTRRAKPKGKPGHFAARAL